MNLHYKVEEVFDDLRGALSIATDNAENLDIGMLYIDLSDDIIDLGREYRGRMDDIILGKEKVAPAAGTTEATSENIFNISIVEKTRSVNIRTENSTALNRLLKAFSDVEAFEKEMEAFDPWN